MDDILPKERAIKASDLRGILEYVNLYRGQTFVVAIDGSIILDENFPNVATDIAVLKSLGINIVIVHGIGRQLKNLAAENSVELSDFYGDKPVDEKTLEYSRLASASASQSVLDAFARLEIKCASTNAVRATELGIISGVDYLRAGRIDKIDFSTVSKLLGFGIVPVFSPLACDREGRLFRINSDLLAAEIASGLKASKLIFLTETRGLAIESETAVAVPISEAKRTLENRRGEIDPRVVSKVEASIRALETSNTPRAHILDGREFSCLLTELFEKVGCGSMIYADEYQKIRKARPEDASIIYGILKISARSQNLVYRSLEEIQEKISRYYVYEMDGSIIAFVCLLDYGGGKAELASLHVQPFYQGHKVGTRMVEFIKMKAKEAGVKTLYALSTKSSPFFTEVCGFRETSPSELPEDRRKKYLESGRNSRVFKANID